ncbi:S8 family serine peptidase [Amnibacterium kyonggiense]|uniref:Peptidase MprA n=1 Tax=Amnibacterium kyonggiense TaxID=595671 RepID=A0A4R7FQP5_9MICO|nr:S8 family serine peptidase [Amnibacterium kyonggiense]TDS80112.1 peptidase MprA [Amnibacterium kyonggiense]
MKVTTRGGLRQSTAIAVAACVTIGMGGTALADELTPDPVAFVLTTAGDAPTVQQLQSTLPSLDVQSVTPLGDGLASVEVSARTSAAAQAEALAASPLVTAATPARRFTVARVPSPVAGVSPWYGEQWDLWDGASTKRAGGFGVDAPRAWTRTFGRSDVVVAVLDTGITPHPDLAGASVVPGYDFVSQTPGVLTGDGDGWDADPSDPGDVCSELGSASTWHGTFVTGEIVAQRDRVGVTGLAPRVSVEPVRVLGGCGGSEADTIAAIEWASGGSVPGVPANAHPAQVLSMSLGSDGGDCSDALQTAVDDAIARGTTIVAAAGNEGTTMANTSPANCAGVVSVVATTRQGSLAVYSNRGSGLVEPSLAAPGGSDADPVIGDIWTSTGAFTAKGNRPAIGTDVGTSMATPRVAAAIALLLSVRPGLDPASVMQRLSATASPFPSTSTCTETRCGAGIVDAGDLVGAKRVLLPTTSATITGAARVGGRLTATSGTWRPAAKAAAYRWLRDGRPIAGATGRRYTLRPADAGHRITVRVQVGRAGALSAASTSPARRIAR